MNVVLFLGAGFSAPFGLPTMDQFLGEVARSDRITPEDKEFIGELVLEARRANSILESSPTNLEDILSFAVMGDRLGIQENSDPKSPRVIKILHNIYSYPKNAESDWAKLRHLRKFLGKDLNEIKEYLSIITTNYDLLAEFAVLLEKAQASLPFEYTSLSASSSHPNAIYAENEIPLFKLHGSLNWHTAEGQANIIVDDRIVNVNLGQGNSAMLPISVKNNHIAPDTTLIVPPTFLKPDLPDALKDSWAGAAKALKSAEVIVFIGYSFPSSDIEMKYFLAKSLSDNPKLREIKIIDKKAENIVTRLRDSSSGFGSHFKDFLKPQKIQDISWTEMTPLQIFQ